MGINFIFTPEEAQNHSDIGIRLHHVTALSITPCCPSRPTKGFQTDKYFYKHLHLAQDGQVQESSDWGHTGTWQFEAATIVSSFNTYEYMNGVPPSQAKSVMGLNLPLRSSGSFTVSLDYEVFSYDANMESQYSPNYPWDYQVPGDTGPNHQMWLERRSPPGGYGSNFPFASGTMSLSFSWNDCGNYPTYWWNGPMLPPGPTKPGVYPSANAAILY